jgi:hypothetical protein
MVWYIASKCVVQRSAKIAYRPLLDNGLRGSSIISTWGFSMI